MEFSGVIALNCDLMKSNSAAVNSFALRKSRAVPITNIPLNVSFKEGVVVCARTFDAGTVRAAAIAVMNSRRSIVWLRLVLLGIIVHACWNDVVPRRFFAMFHPVDGRRCSVVSQRS